MGVVFLLTPGCPVFDCSAVALHPRQRTWGSARPPVSGCSVGVRTFAGRPKTSVSPLKSMGVLPYLRELITTPVDGRLS